MSTTRTKRPQEPRSHLIECASLFAMARRQDPMVVTRCAANVLRSLEPPHVIVILDRLHDIDIGRGSHVVGIFSGTRMYQASVERHRDGVLVLLDVIRVRGP